ncbi:MAG: glycine--tRNA ligase subunit beta, partial [Alphaproteobacteria bacterium]|nr:glycine--tRNA ligase subunit beta [Alphaproteobacteria bacterium]
MATLLFECFSEEMPARMQRGARDQLEQLLTKALAAGNITHGAVRTFASPRHLAITIEDLPELQPDVTIEKKGPKVGAPQAAIDGFLKSTGLASLDACEQRTVGKDTVYFATTTTRGRPMTEWLKDALEQLMRDFTWPKSMRWGAHSIQWVRPLHRITALLDSTIIPVQFGHITASNITEGHRFLAPAPITLAHASEYESALAAAQVMVNADARRNAIHKAATTAAAEAGLTLVEDAGLLDEVTGLVESPFC